MKPTRNHQVNYKKKFVLQAENDPLSHSTKISDHLAFSQRQRRINRSQHERACDAYVLQPLIADLRLEPLQVGEYVRKFRHRTILSERWLRIGAPSATEQICL